MRARPSVMSFKSRYRCTFYAREFMELHLSSPSPGTDPPVEPEPTHLYLTRKKSFPRRAAGFGGSYVERPPPRSFWPSRPVRPGNNLYSTDCTIFSRGERPSSPLFFLRSPFLPKIPGRTVSHWVQILWSFKPLSLVNSIFCGREFPHGFLKPNGKNKLQKFCCSSPIFFEEK